MKKHILLGAALLSLMATSCSNDDIINNDNEVVNGKTITLNATINNGADTRLAYTDNGSSMQVAWSTSESFTMYKGTITEGSTFSNSTDAKGTFKGDDITGEGTTYYAVYGNDITNSAGTLTIDLSGAQVGTNAENGIKEFMLATAETLNDDTKLTFDHKLAVLKLTLTLTSDNTATTAEKITISGLHNKASYTLSDGSYTYADGGKGDITATNGGTGFAITGNKITAYVAVFPEKVDADKVDIIANVGDNEYRYTITQTRELTAGTVTPVTVSMSKVLKNISGVLTSNDIKAAIGKGNNLVIALPYKDIILDDDYYRSFLCSPNYTNGSIYLTLLNQTTLDEDGDEAFKECMALKSVSAPCMISVVKTAFKECNYLTTIDLPLAKSLGEDAFDQCGQLVTVDLPNVETVGNFAFCACTQLSTVTLPKAKSLGEGAFQQCRNLTTISLPSVETIGKQAFYSCWQSLTIVDLPNATSVGEEAFIRCNNIVTLSLPKVNTVGKNAFNSCYALTTLNLSSATEVASDAFTSVPTSKVDLTVKSETTWWKEYTWKSVKDEKGNSL